MSLLYDSLEVSKWNMDWASRKKRLCVPRSHMPMSCPNMGTSYIKKSRNILGKRCRWCYSDQSLQGGPSDPSEYVRNETCVGSYNHWYLHRRRKCLVDFCEVYCHALLLCKPYAKSAIKPSNRNAISLPTSSLQAVLFYVLQPVTL